MTQDSISPMNRAAFLLRRAGVYLNRARRSVWIHAPSTEDFEAAQPLLQWLRTGISAERLLLTSEDPHTCAWLRTRYPNDNTLPFPFSLPPILARFFLQLRPALIILIGDRIGVGQAVLAYARRRSVPVIQVDACAASDRHIPEIDQFCVRTTATAERLIGKGVSPARVHVVESLRGEEAERARATAATIQVIESVVKEIPNAREPMPDKTAPRRMDQLAHSAIGRAIVANRGARGIRGWDALRERLGNPKTILCVGNGPSCEDPQLRDAQYDCLFRVNWRWIERGILTRPDMVFVGDLRTTARLSSCVFGFRTLAWEAEVLLRHLLLDLRLDRLEYFTFERVSRMLSDDRWPAHPTNGIVMVATAVGLQPERIIIGGMDLYQDPRGRYPGETVSDNNYPQMHSREVEVEALRTVLSEFSGKVSIMSEPLRLALSNVPRAPTIASSVS